MLFVGGILYALEIPNYFNWIEKKTASYNGLRQSLYKTALALLYFNPLWIARHLLFIALLSLHWEGISWQILTVALWSFLANIPLSFVANYTIQNKINNRWRFLASALFSAFMAIYYAMSKTWFSL